MAVKKKARKGAGVPKFWRNRIIKSGEVDPAKLLANPANWRAHPEDQSEAIGGVLDEVGWVQRVLVNTRTGHIIDGHERVRIALKKKERVVPVDYVNVSIEDEKKILLTLNSLGDMAEMNEKRLAALLKSVHFETSKVDPLLESIADALNLEEDDLREITPEVPFSEELLEEHNYVVLYFENEVDWLQLTSILKLKTVKAFQQIKENEKTARKGIGRVLKGSEAIRLIQESAKMAGR